MRTGAVILAAGASTRLGTPKQLIRLKGETLLDRTIRICREAGCSPIVVVLGAEADRIRSASFYGDSNFVLNEQWQAGMAASIATGIRSLGLDAEGCLILTCDMPAVSAEHLHKLTSTGEMTASAYSARCGVPAYFPRAMFPALAALQGDAGARALLKQSASVELAGGELDIDSPEDVQRAMELFG